MNSHFRYVDHAVDTCVVLHLFRTGNGTPRGTVKGPLSPHPSGLGSDFYIEAYLTVEAAFVSAMRLLQRGGAELVVTGEHLLWCEAWGTLNISGPKYITRPVQTAAGVSPRKSVTAYSIEAAA